MTATMAYRWRYRQAVEWVLNLPDHAHDRLNPIRAALGAAA